MLYRLFGYILIRDLFAQLTTESMPTVNKMYARAVRNTTKRVMKQDIADCSSYICDMIKRKSRMSAILFLRYWQKRCSALSNPS